MNFTFRLEPFTSQCFKFHLLPLFYFRHMIVMTCIWTGYLKCCRWLTLDGVVKEDVLDISEEDNGAELYFRLFFTSCILKLKFQLTFSNQNVKIIFILMTHKLWVKSCYTMSAVRTAWFDELYYWTWPEKRGQWWCKCHIMKWLRY